MKIFTLGVYNSTEEQFFNKLSDNHIDTFCDIRQRRGVRGREYAFSNSTHLQNKLAEMRINYLHIKKLAPTSEIREKQKSEDARTGELKRFRNKLGQVFANEYCKQILSNFDFDNFVSELKKINAQNVVLLCVEEKACACHRSLVANELQRKYNYEITHL